MKFDRLYIVIPVFNEERNIDSMIESILDEGYKNVIVVDDGSVDATLSIVKKKDVLLIKHSINRGVGAATQTGLDYALSEGAEYVVTIDGDCQHNPKDIKVLFRELIQSNSDIAIGNRFLLKSNKIPFSRRLLNKFANILTFVLCGKYFGDSQSGLKLLSRKAADRIQLKLDRYEFCTEMLAQAVESKLKVIDVPTIVYYSSESRKKGQNLFSGVRMVFKLLFHYSYRWN